jgi:branched-chain amino acid transport system ATP-binding protein
VRTFQITKALARMSVLDNVLLAAPAHPGETLRGLFLRPRAARRRERDARREALELLDLFELRRLADEYAGTLSGGQRKLLELARAVMAHPRVLLLDEPMAGVNRTLGNALLEHIERLRDSRDLTVLYVEHDMDVVMTRSDRVVVMAQGAVIASGRPDAVRRDPRVVDAYLGDGEGTRTA